jgi:predicted aldo/keto reductase-like oxidoreductase
MMRLPVLDNDNAKIDETAVAQMVNYAVEHGVNYIDTAYNYHREQSEIVVGKVLKQGLRDRVYLATKCPTWLVESHDDFDRLLDRQLEKLQTDHIDMYLMHSLSKDRWPTIAKADVFKFIEKAKADGRIRFGGFSFHDDLGTFKTIVDSYNWDFCQMQYNYMDIEFQAGTEGLKYASGKGLAVVVMEPLRGGSLVKNVPPEVQAAWDKSPVKRTPAEWGLRWVWNHPEVSLVLSGMGAMEQVKENLGTAETALPNSLTAQELALYDEVRQSYRARTKANCTKCQYCQPCPQGIVIPEWFGAYNSAYMFNSINRMANFYERSKSEWGDPGACVECGNCEEKCPQRLPVRQLLKDLQKDATPKA